MCCTIFVENSHLSIRKANHQHGISRMAVQKILKKIKFYPYKIHLVQELNEDDFDRRMEFCELMMRKPDNDLNFLFNTLEPLDSGQLGALSTDERLPSLLLRAVP